MTGRTHTVSAPDRELTLPELIAKLPSHEQLVPIKLSPEHRRDGQGRQLASELLGPYQKGRRVNAKMRRRAKRVQALNHDTTRDVIVTDATTGDRRNVGRVTVDEMPLGGALIQPKWLKRQPREKDGRKHDVVKYRLVDGQRVRVTATDEQRSAAAEQMLRAQAYQMNTGNNPDGLTVQHYWESDADHRSPLVRLTESGATAATTVRRNMVRVYGDVCPDCGLMHKGSC